MEAARDRCRHGTPGVWATNPARGAYTFLAIFGSNEGCKGASEVITNLSANVLSCLGRPAAALQPFVDESATLTSSINMVLCKTLDKAVMRLLLGRLCNIR